MPLLYTVHQDAPAADAKAVDSGLDEYNLAEPELRHVRALQVIVKSEEGEVLGGAIGRTWGRCCELLQLWVHESQRGRGVGAQLMRHFESEARARGCNLVYLTTFTFQAPGFYSRLGYDVVHETKGYTGGITWHAMHKRLGDDGSAT